MVHGPDCKRTPHLRPLTAAAAAAATHRARVRLGALHVRRRVSFLNPKVFRFSRRTAATAADEKKGRKKKTPCRRRTGDPSA